MRDFPDELDERIDNFRYAAINLRGVYSEKRAGRADESALLEALIAIEAAADRVAVAANAQQSEIYRLKSLRAARLRQRGEQEETEKPAAGLPE